MSKQIIIPFQDEKYTLEYTRKSIEKMEQRGFKVSDVKDKPVSTLPVLFAGAFLAHHPNINKEIVDAIFAQCSDKSDLLEKLGEMYSEPILVMTESEGNLKWEANW